MMYVMLSFLTLALLIMSVSRMLSDRQSQNYFVMLIDLCYYTVPSISLMYMENSAQVSFMMFYQILLGIFSISII